MSILSEIRGDGTEKRGIGDVLGDLFSCTRNIVRHPQNQHAGPLGPVFRILGSLEGLLKALPFLVPIVCQRMSDARPMLSSVVSL